MAMPMQSAAVTHRFSVAVFRFCPKGKWVSLMILPTASVVHVTTITGCNAPVPGPRPAQMCGRIGLRPLQ